MDWSKTKTIFIIVFSILNVFLYSVYINNYNEEQKLEVLGGTSVENDLKNANITIGKLPASSENVSYVSGKIKTFENSDLEKAAANQVLTIRDNTIIESQLKQPEKLEEITDKTLTDFVKKTVLKGEEYELWSINDAKKEAIFFQVMDDRTIFYNQSASVKVQWNVKNEIIGYEQTMFGSLKAIGEKNTFIKPIQAIKTIFEKGYVKDHTTISFVEMGYSTLVPLTETQVLSPTWHIRAMVPNEDGHPQQKDFFVNAVDNQVVEIEKDIDFQVEKSLDLDHQPSEKLEVNERNIK